MLVSNLLHSYQDISTFNQNIYSTRRIQNKIMGGITLLLTVVAAFLVVETFAAGQCPSSGKVYSCNPRCNENYECSNGKVCCANQCNTKSCVESSSYNTGSGTGGDKYSSGGGAGVYCNNVKCSSFEKCKLDPSTKRMKCMRA